jgi:pimeloyl-ACP methyl ester carboxylesterase
MLDQSTVRPMSPPCTIQYVQANGIRFAFIAEGKVPLVLLFHGFPDTAHTWDHVRPLLAAKGFRAVSPFMRGYQPTEIPPRDTDGPTLAHDALALIDAFGEKDAILVGHDWGASAVYGATAIAQERVRKLVALAVPHPATLRVTPRLAWRLRHFTAYKMPGAAHRFARDNFAALPYIVRRWSPKWSPTDADLAAVRECFANRGSLDAAFGYYRAQPFAPDPFLRTTIRVSAVVFAGLDDPTFGRTDFERSRRIFQGDYVIEEMPGGHFLHREHPALFAERLLAHL